MNYYFYLDESGDHSLTNINDDFPYFLLCGILVSEEENRKLIEQVEKLKYDFFGNTNVILHSRDIRKCNGEFQILFDLKVKEKFYERLNTIIKNIDFQIISVGIKKEDYIKKYGKTAKNPYEISLSYILERLIFCIDGGENTVEILVEKRGKREDKELLEYYNLIYSIGTYYVKPNRFKEKIKGFDFRGKYKNDIGIQLADLCAYPLVSHIRNKTKTNLAFDVLKKKIYQEDGRLFGFKIHP